MKPLENELVIEEMVMLYGMRFRSIQYYTDIEGFIRWFEETKKKLPNDLEYTSKLDCYKKILAILEKQ